MSYSRWIDSKFYTYWGSKSEVENRNDEVFIVHYDLTTYGEFTYTECNRMIENKLYLKGKMNFVDDDLEAEELQGYMKRFIKDVDKEYADGADLPKVNP